MKIGIIGIGLIGGSLAIELKKHLKVLKFSVMTPLKPI